MLQRTIITAVLALCLYPAIGQQDSTEKDKDAWRYQHSPLKATLFSTAVPGLGQIYNRKYWKAPIAWGGLGVAIWFVVDNNKNYQHFKDAYLEALDGNNPYEGRYSSNQLRSISDQYRRWRDLSYVATGLVYLLNIMDAAVDGYFVTFDVSEDLSLGIRPFTDFAAHPINGLSLTLSL